MGISLGSIKKFLHSDAAASMARQALGIPASGDAEDHEGYQPQNIAPPSEFDVMRKRPNAALADTPNLPAPVRTITTSQPPVALPVSAIPAPVRTVPGPNVGGVPPAPSPGLNTLEGVYDNMYPTAAAIPAPIRSPLPTGDPAMAPMPTGAPLPAPQRTPFLGVADRTAAGHVAALQEADPSQSVKMTDRGYEEGPPHKMSRLKAMGKMFLQRMMAGSQYGLGGMLGAGLEGSIEGGVSPEHAQNVLRQGEIQKAQGEQYQAQQLEAGGLRNEADKLNIEQDKQQILQAPQRRQDAEYERDRTNLEQMVGQADKVTANSPQHQAALDAIQTEADRMSQRYGRKVTVIPGEGREPTTFSVDGQIAERQPDGSFKTVFGSPKVDTTNQYHDQESDYTYQTKVGEANQKRAAAQLAAQQAKATAENHQQKVSAAAAALSTLDAQMAAMPATVPSGQMMADGVTPKMMANPALGPLKRQREQLKQQQTSAESAMNAAYKDQRKAEADAAEIYTPPPPPKRSKRASPTGGAKIMPRANLPAAAERLIQQGKIKSASEAEAYIVANGGTVQ